MKPENVKNDKCRGGVNNGSGMRWDSKKGIDISLTLEKWGKKKGLKKQKVGKPETQIRM